MFQRLWQTIPLYNFYHSWHQAQYQIWEAQHQVEYLKSSDFSFSPWPPESIHKSDEKFQWEECTSTNRKSHSEKNLSSLIWVSSCSSPFFCDLFDCFVTIIFKLCCFLPFSIPFVNLFGFDLLQKMQSLVNSILSPVDDRCSCFWSW